MLLHYSVGSSLPWVSACGGWEVARGGGSLSPHVELAAPQPDVSAVRPERTLVVAIAVHPSVSLAHCLMSHSPLVPQLTTFTSPQLADMMSGVIWPPVSPPAQAILILTGAPLSYGSRGGVIFLFVITSCNWLTITELSYHKHTHKNCRISQNDCPDTFMWGHCITLYLSRIPRQQRYH